MDVGSVIDQLIEKDISFPALKLVLDNQVDLKCTSELPKITPSHYLRENGFTTDQRLALLCKQQRRMSCWRPGNDVVVEPAIIVFQNYNSGETLQVPINIRNTSKVSQKVVVLMDENSIFKLDESSQRVGKFPCGMTITSTVNFYPEDDRDYYHKLVIHTNTSRFAIPIVCIGGRGLLSAPDSIVFEHSPVKYMSTKTIPLYNNGRRPARFTLSTTGPFCVSPEQGVVPPKDSFSMNVSFYADFLGEYDGYLVIKYENGEEVYICLRAESVNLNISVQPREVEFEDIYVGLPSKFVCSLTNDSDYILDFKWKKESRGIDSSKKSITMLTESLRDSLKRPGGDAGDALDRVIDLLENCGDGDEDCLGVALGLEDQLINLKNGEQLFSDECFLIEPLSGQLQPRSSIDIYIIFTPQRPVTHSVTPYLDISGNEDRIPLPLCGNGLGPKFRFGYEKLDVGIVFFGGAHAYEIPVVNVGAISGKVAFDTVMGLSSNPFLNLKVEPRKLDLEPDEHGAFYVSFHCAAKTGPFEDELKFIIPKTKEQVYVSIGGSVSYPSIRFHERELKFDDISYGFPKSAQITVLNDSLNQVEICLAAENDGVDPPIDYNMIIKSFSEEAFHFPEDPSEFIIEPNKFSLTPRGMQKVTINCCPNEVREIKTSLLCYVADKNFEPIDVVAHIPVSGTCVVPYLENGKENLIVDNCYVHFPCPTELFVKNTSDLPVCYCLVPHKSRAVKLASEKMVGVAEAFTTTSIPVKFTCTTTGRVTAIIDVYAVGEEEKMFTFTVKIDVLPSQIKTLPRVLDFGHIDVLKLNSQYAEISNESPLTVACTLALTDSGKRGEVWELDVLETVVEPYSTSKIGISVLLREPGPHTANVHIKIIESQTFLDIALMAYGEGSSIEFTPALENQSAIEFGTMFIKMERYFQYEIKNVGHLPKFLDWRHSLDPHPNNPVSTKKGTPQSKSSGSSDSNSSNGKKKKDLEDDHYMRKMIFTISPEKVTLQPGASVLVNFTSSSKRATLADESVQLWTYTPPTIPDPNFKGRKNPNDPKKDSFAAQPYLTREIRLKANYERPGLVFSKKLVSFKIDAIPTLESFEQRETLTITNHGTLPVSVCFKTSNPFYMIHEKGVDVRVTEWQHDFESEDTVRLILVFDIRFVSKEKSQVVFDSALEVHYVKHFGSKDSIAIRGQVNFLTLHLEKTEIDFGTIVNGTEAVEDLTVTNEGPHPLTFKWHILPGTTMVTRGRHQVELDRNFLGADSAVSEQDSIISFKDLPGPRTTATSRMTAESIYRFKFSKDFFGRTTSSESLDHYDESVQVERERLQRSRLLDIVGLKDPDDETESEFNYFAHHIAPQPAEREIFISEIVDIIPLAGTVPAGSSQTFTVVFYGHNDMNFQTTAFCHIEGGTGVSIPIRGISSPRPASLIIKRPVSKLTPSSSKISTVATLETNKEKDSKKKKPDKIEETKPKPKRRPRKPKKKESRKSKKHPPCNLSEPGDSRIAADTLQLLGSCVPAISNDPDILFQKNIDFRLDDDTIVLNKVYIKDEDCFDFGPTLVPLRRSVLPSMGNVTEISAEIITPTPRTKHKENVSKFTVRNISAMRVSCTLCLVHGRTKYFEFQPEHFTVEPGAQQVVTLWAYPRLPEVVIEDHLVFCIKDNPDPIFFRVRVVGTTPRVFMEQSILNFGKTLLNSRSVAHVTVVNTGLIPVVWQLSKATPLPEHVYTEKIQGTIKPKDSADIRFLFKSGLPTLINEATVDIEFLDTQGILGVVDVFKLAMYGESYDVVVDILSEKKEFTLIDFGVLPVGYPIVQNIVVSNRGNYDIFFRFIVEPEKLSYKNKQFTRLLKDYMLIFPTEDALESNQASVVQVVFEPPREMHFINEPILKIQLVDLLTNVLVAELTIPVSVKGERQSISADDPNR